MIDFKPFRCAECGGMVQLLAKPGRSRIFARGVTVPIPDAFQIPTCPKCGEEYLSPAIEDELDAVLREHVLKAQISHYRDLVGYLKRRYSVTLRDIERVCAVTPTYFSLVLNGKRRASATLTRLLEAFVVCGDEFVRHLKDRPWVPVEPLELDVREESEGFVADDVGAWDDQPKSLRIEASSVIVELGT